MDRDGRTGCEEFCSEWKTWRAWAIFWFMASGGLLIALCLHIAMAGSLPKSVPSTAAVVTQILLGEKVPPDVRIISLVRRKTGNLNFGAKTLAWYKTKARQGKLQGQDGMPHVIDQRVARYRA